MASAYPDGLDDLVNPTPTSNMATVSHSAQHIAANDAIEAIEGTLGVSPQGTEETVVARLDAIDETLTTQGEVGTSATEAIGAVNTLLGAGVEGTETTVADRLDAIDTAVGGRIVGPAVAVDDGIVTFDGTTGLLAQDSGATLAAGDLTITGVVTAAGLGGDLLSSETPTENGTATVGVAAVPAREDHVHPSDSTKVDGATTPTDNSIVRFDGTDGVTIQDSGIIIDDTDNLTGIGTISSGAITSSGAVQAGAETGFVVGANGPKILSGTGSPEGVVTAPVGSTWLDTAATTGAVKWIKASGTGNTGWKVEYGDTGARNLVASATPHANTTVTYFQVRRQGSSVTLFYYQSTSSSVNDVLMFDALPVGFRPSFQITAIRNRGGVVSALDQIVWDIRSNGQVYYSSAGASTMQGEVTWQTSDAWPTSLPGSAA